MPIPESQLTTWSNQGAVASAKITHEAIRTALGQYRFPNGVDYEIYLQGSYKNDTNIRGDSDVDVVVQLNSTIRCNTSLVTDAERRMYDQIYSDAAYDWQEFRTDVLRALQTKYGRNTIQEGKKSLKFPSGVLPLPADVVVALTHRTFKRISGQYDQEYLDGMTLFVPQENRWIINYPKIHYNNGVAKNSSSNTNQWFKPTVRIFKNARTYLVDRHLLAESIAPSYCVECLIWNAPDSKFGASYQDTFCNVVNWMSSVDLNSVVCQHCQSRLCATSLLTSTPECWPTSNANTFIQKLIELWSNW